MNLFSPQLPSARTVSFSFAGILVFYLAYIIYTGYESILAALSTLHFSDWFILLACSLSSYVIRFSRWQYYLYRFQHQIPVLKSFAYYIAGFSLTTTPGKAGETIRSLYLHQHRVKFSESLSAFFTERFYDVIIVAFLSSLVLLHFIEYQSVIITSIILLIVIVVLFAYGNTHQFIEAIIPSTRFNFINKLLSHLGLFLKNTRQLFLLKPLIISLTLGSIAWLLQCLAFVYLLKHFSIELNLWVALGIYSASLLAGAISFIPGGIGTTEAAMAFLLIAVGVDKQTALVIPFIIRIASLWFAVSLGTLSIVILGLAGIKIDDGDVTEPGTKHSD